MRNIFRFPFFHISNQSLFSPRYKSTFSHTVNKFNAIHISENHLKEFVSNKKDIQKLETHFEETLQSN